MIAKTADESRISKVDIGAKEYFAKDMARVGTQRCQAKEGISIKIKKHDTGKSMQEKIGVEPTGVSRNRRKIVNKTNV